jgi:hypothetical protein
MKIMTPAQRLASALDLDRDEMLRQLAHGPIKLTLRGNPPLTITIEVRKGRIFIEPEGMK